MSTGLTGQPLLGCRVGLGWIVDVAKQDVSTSWHRNEQGFVKPDSVPCLKVIQGGGRFVLATVQSLTCVPSFPRHLIGLESQFHCLYPLGSLDPLRAPQDAQRDC